MPSISPRSGGSGCPRWPRIAAELCGHACMRRPLLVASCWLVWLVAAATTFLARRTINGNSRIASQHGNRQREPRIEYGKKKKRGNRFGKSYSARVPKNVLNGTPRLKETTRKFFVFTYQSSMLISGHPKIIQTWDHTQRPYAQRRLANCHESYSSRFVILLLDRKPCRASNPARIVVVRGNRSKLLTRHLNAQPPHLLQSPRSQRPALQ